ncbi:13203_t:CDS:2 [Funneliformis caledonium]|uniref:13203_t:CDS:1 n=1 Tax=Funneliformis caledonium TaxID=1117310 RepID=A0A9N9C0J7_9GLOM|nr:13203_t:CDS:2 [Funneliformis caledonium]
MTNNSKRRKVELSDTLQQWLESRIRPKLQMNLTTELAWKDIIKDILKDICIKILAPLSLEVFASAMNRLAQIDDNDRLYLIERILTFTPNPDMVSGEMENVLRDYLMSHLSTLNNSKIEIKPDLIDVAQAVLQRSHKDWISTCEAISSFLKDCSTNYNTERNVYVVYPHLSDISRKIFLDKEQRNSVERFFTLVQDVASSLGFRFKDLVETYVTPHDQDMVQNVMSELFPKGLPIDNNKKLRPRWHNQQYMMFLALQRAPNKTLSRGELIKAAISLDEKCSDETGLPRCFTGQTPRNSASACLTTNADKYFKVFKTDSKQNTTFYKLSFVPNDRNDAIYRYKQWMQGIIEHDWVLCFGKPKKSRTGQSVTNNGNVIMLTVGAGNPVHVRCRRCIEKSCDAKLPACGRCRQRGHLCIYPLRIGVHEKTERLKAKRTPLLLTYPEQTIEIDTRPATATRNKKKLQQQLLEQQKRLDSEDPDICRASLPDEILNGLDLSNVPKSLDDVVEVRPSTIQNAGNGLFAKRNLPMATPLGFYFGVPMMEDDFDNSKDKIGRASHYSMRYKHTILDATDEKGEPFTDPNGPIFCPFHFMNEDPFGNMVFLEGGDVNQVICWTKRDIRKGEELFVYYGGDVDREHWGQAGNNSDQLVNECDSEEEVFVFSEESDGDEETIDTCEDNINNVNNINGIAEVDGIEKIIKHIINMHIE